MPWPDECPCNMRPVADSRPQFPKIALSGESPSKIEPTTTDHASRYDNMPPGWLSSVPLAQNQWQQTKASKDVPYGRMWPPDITLNWEEISAARRSYGQLLLCSASTTGADIRGKASQVERLALLFEMTLIISLTFLVLACDTVVKPPPPPRPSWYLLISSLARTTC